MEQKGLQKSCNQLWLVFIVYFMSLHTSALACGSITKFVTGLFLLLDES